MKKSGEFNGLWYVLLFVAFISFIVAAIFFFAVMPGRLEDLDRVTKAEIHSLGELEAAQPGSDAVLTGILDENEVPQASNIIDQYAANQSLVLYAWQVWEVVYHDDDGTTNSDWRNQKTIIPKTILLDGKSLPLAQDSAFFLEGDLYTSPVVQKGRGEAHGGFNKGDLRVYGFKQGDHVTLFGKLNSQGSLVLEYAFGGSQAEFNAYIADQTRRNQKLLVIFFGIGCGMVFIFLVGVVAHQVRKKQADEAAGDKAIYD
jgi:hypothetical protein